MTTAKGATVIAGTTVAATAAFSLGGPAVAATLIAATAAMSAGVVAARHRSRVWSAIALYAAAGAANTITAGGVADAPALTRAVGPTTFAVAALSSTVAIWLGARPFLAVSSTRIPTRIAASAAACSIVVIAARDAMVTRGSFGPVTDMITAVLAVIAPASTAFAGLYLLRVIHQLGRQAEAVMALGAVVHLAVHVAALAAERTEGIWLALATSSASILIASVLSSAPLVGAPVSKSGDTLAVRVWPIAVAVGLAVSGWFASTTNAGVTVAAGCIGAALIVAAFSARELGGPRKPLVVPFSSRDRTLHRLPSQLMSGSVPLIGRPVHRVADGSLVGIEAEPGWTGQRHGDTSLVEIAKEAGLEGWLQRVTVGSAHEHLPEILARLEGDEPFLSIPFRAPLNPADIGENATFDGLVLRFDDPDALRIIGQIDDWLDRGAMVQGSDGPDHDITVVPEGQRAPLTSMGLTRTANADHLALLRDGVMYVVDLSDRAEAIGALFSVGREPTSE